MKLSVSKMESLPIKVDSVWTPGYKVKQIDTSNDNMHIQMNSFCRRGKTVMLGRMKRVMSLPDLTSCS